MADTKSETKVEKSFVDLLIDSKHYVTTIKDGKDKIEARGDTAKQAEERASKRWEEKKNK